MGLYDRDYLRDEYERPQRRLNLPAPQSMTVALIVANVAVFFANFLFTPPNPLAPNDIGWLNETLSVNDLTLKHPWMWWQLLTSGFAHANIQHIIFNMLQLYFLGKLVEDIYGKWEYLRFYLATVVFGSVVWSIGELLFPPAIPGTHFALGASGAICGVVMLFVLNNPHQRLTLFPIPITLKAWVAGVILIVSNVALAFGDNREHIAWSIHLGGAAFAYLYFSMRWNIGNLLPGLKQKMKQLSGPKLRVHKPDDEPLDLGEEVDRILEKIHTHGEGSLTKQERRMLEIASQQYQKRRKE